MQYTIRMEDGPSLADSNIEETLVPVDSNVATVSGKEILAHKLGETTLKYVLRHKSLDKIVAETQLKVRVELVASIDIAQKWNRAIYKESLIKQIVVLKNIKNETFAHGSAPINYDWISEDDHIMIPHPKFSEEDN